MKQHQLKTWPEYFIAVRRKDKTFEIRNNDRKFEVGDILILQEYHPKHECYTGKEEKVIVTYILDKQPFVPEGYVCMGIKHLKVLEY